MTTLHAIQPFEDFRGSLSSVRFPEVREQIALRSDDTAFDQMREFLRAAPAGRALRSSVSGRGRACRPIDAGGGSRAARPAPQAGHTHGRDAELAGRPATRRLGFGVTTK
jgi:hypothetical protein